MDYGVPEQSGRSYWLRLAREHLEQSRRCRVLGNRFGAAWHLKQVREKRLCAALSDARAPLTFVDFVLAHERAGVARLDPREKAIMMRLRAARESSG